MSENVLIFITVCSTYEEDHSHASIQAHTSQGASSIQAHSTHTLTTAKSGQGTFLVEDVCSGTADRKIVMQIR